MAEEIDNPLDDDLLRELGLEPKPAAEGVRSPPPPPKAPPPAAKGQARAPMTPVAKKPPTPVVPPKTTPPVPDSHFQAGIKNLANDIPVQVVAVLGKRSMPLKEIIGLKQGEILEFKKLPQESIDLVVNGKLAARGELVLVDGKLGVQIKQLVS